MHAIDCGVRCVQTGQEVVDAVVEQLCGRNHVGCACNVAMEGRVFYTQTGGQHKISGCMQS